MKREQVREATPDDADDLARLITQLGYPTSTSDMQGRLRAILDDRDYQTFVAAAGARLVGFVGVRLGRYYEKNETLAQIAALVVDEAVRGSGFGGLLLHAAETWAASRGASDTWVTSHQRRQDAQQFYQAHGYETTGLRFQKRLVPAV